jgi:glycosyltransferase involved in cell wall biosynthesis
MSEKSKICYVLPEYDEKTGSHFFHLYELLGRASRGLDIFLVIERCAGKPDKFSIPFYCQRFSFPPLRFLEFVLILLRERFRGRRYFYTHYSYYGGLASWLVTRLLGGTAYYWNCGMPWLYRRPWLEERIFRFILRHTVFVTGTPGIAEEYRRRYGLKAARIRILPNWVNVERFGDTPPKEDCRRQLGLPSDKKIILFVHRLSRRKGAHLLPEIIVGVTAMRKDAMFVIVGDGPERENLESRIQNLGLEKYARVVGEVPHRELPAYYRVADVFLMPSEEEGFPHVLLEAMAAGVPYVASDVGGVREFTPPELQQYVVPSGDIRQFSEKIVSLLAMGDSERERIKTIEQEWVRSYGITSIVPQFVKLFE